jgi:hypothetical protein
MPELAYCAGEEPRALFPERVFPTSNKEGIQGYKIDMVHRNYGYVFVEAGVKQPLTYVTVIPESLRFVVVRAEFTYENHDPHSVKRVFEVKAG